MSDSSSSITVTVNGEPREIPAGATCAELLQRLEGDPGRRLALEVNEEIVPRGRWADHVLREGDRVEIIHAIGGGAA